MFENLKRVVAPEEHPPPSGVRPCHLVTKARERAVLKELFQAGMIVLVPESKVPCDSHGDPILGGFFCVAHKEDTDRLINDRRPPKRQRAASSLGVFAPRFATLPTDPKGS